MPKPFGPPTLYALFSERKGYFKSLIAANGYPKKLAEDQLKRLPVKDKYRVVKLVPQ
jgi:hypothetical protein